MTSSAYEPWDDSEDSKPVRPTKEQQIEAAIRKHFPDGGRVKHINKPRRSPPRTVARCEICGERLAAELVDYGRHLLCGTTANETPDWSADAGQPIS